MLLVILFLLLISCSFGYLTHGFEEYAMCSGGIHEERRLCAIASLSSSAKAETCLGASHNGVFKACGMDCLLKKCKSDEQCAGVVFSTRDDSGFLLWAIDHSDLGMMKGFNGCLIKPEHVVCNQLKTCKKDAICNDGTEPNVIATCAYGGDCQDCGARAVPKNFRDHRYAIKDFCWTYEWLSYRLCTPHSTPKKGSIHLKPTTCHHTDENGIISSTSCNYDCIMNLCESEPSCVAIKVLSGTSILTFRKAVLLWYVGAYQKPSDVGSPCLIKRNHILCTDQCSSAGNGVCDDGEFGSTSSKCTIGSDCNDCGERSTEHADHTPHPANGCAESCPTYNHDSICDDGLEGSVTNNCLPGTDCHDCGIRYDLLKPTPTPKTSTLVPPPAHVTEIPTTVPTAVPTAGPTTRPTVRLTAVPTSVPTVRPTAIPIDTTVPTALPGTVSPTNVPTSLVVRDTLVPNTRIPTAEPIIETAIPTTMPSVVPTMSPTVLPVKTSLPIVETSLPTIIPTSEPTALLSSAPTDIPPSFRTIAPTGMGSMSPKSGSLASNYSHSPGSCGYHGVGTSSGQLCKMTSDIFICRENQRCKDSDLECLLAMCLMEERCRGLGEYNGRFEYAMTIHPPGVVSETGFCLVKNPVKYELTFTSLKDDTTQMILSLSADSWTVLVAEFRSDIARVMRLPMSEIIISEITFDGFSIVVEIVGDFRNLNSFAWFINRYKVSKLTYGDSIKRATNGVIVWGVLGIVTAVLMSIAFFVRGISEDKPLLSSSSRPFKTHRKLSRCSGVSDLSPMSRTCSLPDIINDPGPVSVTPTHVSHYCAAASREPSLDLGTPRASSRPGSRVSFTFPLEDN